MGPDIGPAAVRRVQSEPNGAGALAAARPAWAAADWDPRRSPPSEASDSPSHHHHLRAPSSAGSDTTCGSAATQSLPDALPSRGADDCSGSPPQPPARPRLASGVFIPLQGATAVAKGRHNKAVRAAAAAAAAASRALTPGAAAASGGTGRRSLDAASPEPDPNVFVIHPAHGPSVHPCPRSPAQRRATFSCGAGPAYAPSLAPLAEHRHVASGGGCSMPNGMGPLPGGCGGQHTGGGNPSGPLFLVPAPSPPPVGLYSPCSSSAGDFSAPPLSPAGLGPLHASLPLLGSLPLPGGATPGLTPANSLRDCGAGFDSGPLSPQFISAPAVTAAAGDAPGKAHAAATAAAQAALQAATTALAAAQQAAVTAPAPGCGGAAGVGPSAEVQVAAAAELLQRAQLLQQQVVFEGQQQQQQQQQQRLHLQLLQRCQQQQEEETLMLWNGLGLGASGVPLPSSTAGLMLSQPCNTPGGAPASPMASGPQLSPLPLSPTDIIGEPLFSAPAALHCISGTAAATGCYGQQQRPLSASCSHVQPDCFAGSALGGPGVGSFALWPSAAPAASNCGPGGSAGRLPQMRFAAQQPPQPQPAVGFEQLATLREMPGLMSSGPWA